MQRVAISLEGDMKIKEIKFTPKDNKLILRDDNCYLELSQEFMYWLSEHAGEGFVEGIKSGELAIETIESYESANQLRLDLEKMDFFVFDITIQGRRFVGEGIVKAFRFHVLSKDKLLLGQDIICRNVFELI